MVKNVIQKYNNAVKDNKLEEHVFLKLYWNSSRPPPHLHIRLSSRVFATRFIVFAYSARNASSTGVNLLK